MELLAENERSANKAAAKVMRITLIVFAAVLLLDIVGIFTVTLSVMIASYLISAILLLIPTFIVNVKKINYGWVKYVIVICAMLFTSVVAATLSYHGVIIYVYPIGIASLYFSGKLNNFSTVLTIVGVSVGQCIAFKFDFVTDHNFTDVKKLVLFGILPRAMSLFAVSAIFTMLCRRTADMLGNLMGAEQQRLMREKSLEVSRKLLDTVTELDKISAAAAEANRRIADESESVMRDSETNSEYIKSVEENMSVISKSLNDLSEMSRSIAESAERSDEITADNDVKITAASDSMNEICRGTDESREIISRLSEQSKQIADISNVITGISMQTNILALNAAVEAAHAGENGTGFAVVASEIKELSEQTKSAAAEISDIIVSVTDSISGAVAAMEKNAALTRDGMDSMEQMRISAGQISVSNRDISGHISDMYKIMGSVAANGENVSKKLVTVSGNIENNCGAVQHVAAAIEENSAGTENLGYMVKNIKQMAEELEKLAE